MLKNVKAQDPAYVEAVEASEALVIETIEDMAAVAVYLDTELILGEANLDVETILDGELTGDPDLDYQAAYELEVADRYDALLTDYSLTRLLDLVETRMAYWADHGWNTAEDVIQFNGEETPERLAEKVSALAISLGA